MARTHMKTAHVTSTSADRDSAMANSIATISEAALLMRIDRFLSPLNQKVRKARGDYAKSSLGEYYLVDVDRNVILETHVQIEAMARRLGVLESWENVTT